MKSDKSRFYFIILVSLENLKASVIGGKKMLTLKHNPITVENLQEKFRSKKKRGIRLLAAKTHEIFGYFPEIIIKKFFILTIITNERLPVKKH